MGVLRFMTGGVAEPGPETRYCTSDGRSVLPQDLPRLSGEEQLDVMETWFRERYEDPAERTPYESAEGGYIWIWGGPYEADEVLGDEFGDKVSQETIDSLVEDLGSECSIWAPTSLLEDYDELFADIAGISDYHANFLDGLHDIRQLADSRVDSAACLFRLLYINVITILETYLSDAFTNTVLNDPGLLRKFIENAPNFQKEKINLSDIYRAVDNAEEKARNYLRQIIWHHLFRVRPMYRGVLNVNFPEAPPIFRAVEIRHDLVHRNGKTKDGEAIPIDKGHVLSLADEVEKFVEQIDGQLQAVRRDETGEPARGVSDGPLPAGPADVDFSQLT